ncbi:MAG TPA: hypothetical protein VNF07_09875 [Acidimicrobiales bacterium]|nr:hypothetical protein [Acidimicrobiales bacterium]
MYYGTITTAATSTVITFDAGSGFTSTTSYACAGTDQTKGPAPAAVKIVNTSTTSITVTVASSGDKVSWICVGT